MSFLDKLQIQGIRSFSPDENKAASIKFFSPLTLVVGQNGSGKTTIIECLKYATTGEMPPNTKQGGAFIHDLKLLGTDETKAMVKLQFTATTGARMVVSRRQQVVQQKVRRVVKTLDSNLLVSRNGEKTSLTSRLAELDLIVPQYLGVSKAILENVIFCHQDDSLWPLSEPASLKKKFDEIFEAQKYTKAVENIKQLRKHQGEELSRFKIIEINAKQDKDRGAKLMKSSRSLHSELEGLHAEVDELEVKIKEAANKASTALENAGKFEETIGRITTLRGQQQFLQQRIEQLGQDLEVSSESDDQLNTELGTYHERLEQAQERQDGCHRRSNDVQQEIDRQRSQRDNKRTEAGTYKEQKRAHEKKIQDRTELIRNAAREYNIRGFDTDLDNEQIGDFMDRIARLSKDQTAKVEKLRRDNAAEAKKVQDILDDLLEKRTEAQQAKNYAKGQVSENERKIAGLQADLDKIVSDEGQKAVIEGNINELQNKLAKARQDSAGAGWDKRLQATSTKLRESEETAEALNRELIESTNQSSSLARLDHLRKETKDRQTSLKTLLETYGSKLKDLIGRDVDLGTLEGDVAEAVESANRALVKAQKERDDASRGLQQVDFQRTSIKTQVSKKTEELNNCARVIFEAIENEPEEYFQVLKDDQENRDILANDVEKFAVLKQWYGDIIKTANDTQCCRVCTRKFDEKREVEQFVQKMTRQATAARLEELQQQLNEHEASLKKSQGVRGSYDMWLKLKTEELPAMKTESRRLEQERKELLRKVEDLDAVVSEREDTKQDADFTSKTAANIVRSQHELNNLQRQVDELIQNQAGDHKLRALTDIKDDIDALNREMREVRGEQTKLQSDEKRSRDQTASLELNLSNAKSQLITANADLERKTTKLGQIEELKQSSQQRRAAMEKHDEELQRVEPRLREENSRLNDMRRQGQSREGELQREANDIMNELNLLTNADREIRFYIEQGGPIKLAQCEREIQALDSAIGALESESRDVAAEINRIQTDLSNADRIRRIINDNLRYREAERELHQNDGELRELEQLDVEADQAQHRREYERCRRYHDNYSMENVSKKGTIKAKDDELKRMIDEWEADYKDAAKKYKEAHIQVETTKAAVEDLGRYGGALDKAIMKFHSLKMEEINQIVDELWKRTYKGTDVDSISIRSDNETARGNRSYNYRVVMVKQGSEMDMRGRCSAGQRVLASIIIRLALAECFGVHCGMIALDEPTTNLDRENIRSLAESLHDIIQVRRAQRNFQLIVITHDEEFLTEMRCSDFAEEYYRVERDPTTQMSRILKQNVSIVMGG